MAVRKKGQKNVISRKRLTATPKKKKAPVVVKKKKFTPPDGQSLCWYCQNAIPNREWTRGCSWSRSFEPVEGWKAKKGEGKMGTYCVRSCPEFLADEPRDPAAVLNGRPRKAGALR